MDTMVDTMFPVIFIKEQFKLLFEKVKECFSLFGAWWSTRKETLKEKEERERREREQTIEANEREIARLQREQDLLRAQSRCDQHGRST